MYFVTFNTTSVVMKVALWADSTRRHRLQRGMFMKDVWSLDISVGCLSPESWAAPCPRAACWLPTAVTMLHSPRPRHSALRSPPRRHLVTRAGGNTEPPKDSKVRVDFTITVQRYGECPYGQQASLRIYANQTAIQNDHCDSLPISRLLTMG